MKNRKKRAAAESAILPLQKESFLSFFKEKHQKKRLAVFAIFYLVCYFALTYFYPFPDGISDSGLYLLSAAKNEFYGYRPFGYSEFLIVLHDFVVSISFVVFVQYWLSVLVTLFFVFSLHFFIKPINHYLSIAFDILALCSIPTLYLTNTILSDSLFASVTLLWIALCFWVLSCQKQYIKILLVVFQFLLLYILMTVRYTGLFYVGVEIVFIVLLFFRKKKLLALGCIACLTMISVAFYNDQVRKNEFISGVKVFSGFTGWQKANNALHVIPYIDIDLTQIDDIYLREFIRIAKKTSSNLKVDGFKTTPTFLWDNDKPLKRFHFLYARKTQKYFLPSWIELGKETYNDFGTYIMVHYPIAYFRYYLLPNFVGTLYCTNDQLYAKEFSKDVIRADVLASWYGIDSKKEVFARSSFIHSVSSIFPVWELIVWLLMFASILCFLIKRHARLLTQLQRNMYWVLVLFVMSYLAFHVYAAPFELRYVIPIYIMQLSIIYLSLYAAMLAKQSTLQGKK